MEFQTVLSGRHYAAALKITLCSLCSYQLCGFRQVSRLLCAFVSLPGNGDTNDACQGEISARINEIMQRATLGQSRPVFSSERELRALLLLENTSRRGGRGREGVGGNRRCTCSDSVALGADPAPAASEGAVSGGRWEGPGWPPSAKSASVFTAASLAGSDSRLWTRVPPQDPA